MTSACAHYTTPSFITSKCNGSLTSMKRTPGQGVEPAATTQKLHLPLMVFMYHGFFNHFCLNSSGRSWRTIAISSPMDTGTEQKAQSCPAGLSHLQLIVFHIVSGRKARTPLTTSSSIQSPRPGLRMFSLRQVIQSASSCFTSPSRVEYIPLLSVSESGLTFNLLRTLPFGALTQRLSFLFRTVYFSHCSYCPPLHCNPSFVL